MLKGIFWDLVDKLSNQGISFGISILLARLLSPEEFGLIGMIMVFVGMSQVFLDMGLGSALVQRQNITQKHISSVFYLNLMVGLFLTLTLFFLSGFIAGFYKRPELNAIGKALSFLFVLDSLVIVQYALFAKNMNFKLPAIVRVVATFISGIVGIYLAYKGYGVWSLVIQSLLSSVISVIGIWFGSAWKPTLQFEFKLVKDLWGFSSKMFFSGVIDSVFSRLDVLIIGKIFSAGTLGFYTRAQSLNNLVVQYTSGSLARVFFPSISKIQDDLVSIKELYTKVVSIISFLVFGLLGFFFLAAEEIFVFLFSSKWLPAVEYFKILILGGYAYPLNNIMISILSGRGKAGKFLQLEVLKKILMVGAFCFGFTFGISGFLYSLVVVHFFMLILNMIFVKQEIVYSFSKQFILVFQYFLVAAVAGLVVIGVERWLSSHGGLRILQVGLFFTLIYLLLNLAFRTKAVSLLYEKISFAFNK